MAPQEGLLIRSVLSLVPKDGDYQAVVDFYRRHGILERASRQDGCLGSELQVSADDHGSILVTALWRDRRAYEGWVENPARAATAHGLDELVAEQVDGDIRGRLYEVELAAGHAEPFLKATDPGAWTG